MLADVLLRAVVERWWLIALVLLAAYLARNRYHNGLNRYPGPLMASLTDWWRLWDVWGRRPELTHIRLHEKHGDVVRLGPNVLSFSDPKALKSIYGLNKGMIKSGFYAVQMATAKGETLPSLFSTLDNDWHAQFRRCVSAAFGMSALVQYEPFVDSTTALFLEQTERLFARTGRACDFTQWLQFYAFDVIGEITYGQRHGFLERNEDVDGIVADLAWIFDYVAPIGQIPILDKLFVKNPIKLKLAQWGLVDSTFPVARFAAARMAERTPTRAGEDAEKDGAGKKLDRGATTGTQRRDLLSKFIATREARPEMMTDRMVRTMATTMAFAGSETTAISLAAVFYYLLREPAAMARLRAEIDDAGRRGVFADTSSGLVTWQESQELPYLDAVIKEAFRVHPAAGLPLERVVPRAGAEIAGRHVPSGTIVGVSAWVLHRNREVFGEDADVFRPERWLIAPDDGNIDEERRERERQRVKGMNATMLQFGMGSRTCIGKNVSLLEMYKVIPAFLRRFEIKFEDPSQEWELRNSWFVKQLNFTTLFEPREIVRAGQVKGVD